MPIASQLSLKKSGKYTSKQKKEKWILKNTLFLKKKEHCKDQ